MNKTPLLEFVYNRKKTAGTNIDQYIYYIADDILLNSLKVSDKSLAI